MKITVEDIADSYFIQIKTCVDEKNVFISFLLVFGNSSALTFNSEETQ